MALEPLVSMAKLARVPGGEFPGLLAKMLSLPADANLYMSQFHLFSVIGNHDFAIEMQARALAMRTIYRIESKQKPRIRLLALMGAGEQSFNMPLDYLIEAGDIQLDLLYIVPGLPMPMPVPEHDVAIIALGESDENQAVLALMDTLTKNWPRPLLNRVQSIQQCARDRVYQRLKNISGLCIPPTHRIFRHDLMCIATRSGGDVLGGVYPVTIRPLLSRGGRGLCKIANPTELEAYLNASDEDEFFISFYIDYSSQDGLYRKLRIALIDGRPYICHLAISDRWIVHYGSADMAASEVKRNEEARVMRDFDDDFALRHAAALSAIAQRLALDYVVIDCAETQEGELLVFEADNRGWVHATDSIDVFLYKQAPMHRVFDAFRDLLFKAMSAT
ncbi:MAG: RimK family alpha-L-glutamate ligase [Gallionella sp.]